MPYKVRHRKRSAVRRSGGAQATPAVPASAVTHHDLHFGKPTDRGQSTPALSKSRICQARARPLEANPEFARQRRVRSKQILNLPGNGRAAPSKARFS